MTFLSQKVMFTEDLKIAQSVYVDFSNHCNPNTIDIFGALFTLSLIIILNSKSEEGARDVNNLFSYGGYKDFAIVKNMYSG